MIFNTAADASSSSSSSFDAHAKVPWNMRGAWLLAEVSHACDPAQDAACTIETAKVLVLLITLCTVIAFVVCAFHFFREDKEEQITPLCPQLVVKETELKFTIPEFPFHTDTETFHNMDVLDETGKDFCKLSLDWPDPFRGSAHGVAATVRLHKSDMTLATIVARNVAVMGQGIALCRTGCEIFGFVEPEGNRYLVRHRTGVHLLTLIGSFGNGSADDSWDIEGVNYVGSKVFSMKKSGGTCKGKVTQHVDAGLVLCAIMATYVHRRLSQPSGTGEAGMGIRMDPEPQQQSVENVVMSRERLEQDINADMQPVVEVADSAAAADIADSGRGGVPPNIQIPESGEFNC